MMDLWWNLIEFLLWCILMQFLFYFRKKLKVYFRKMYESRPVIFIKIIYNNNLPSSPINDTSYNSDTRDNLAACKTCGRTFAEDRIKFHEKVCVKVANIKRKKFDAMTFRIKGTELEPFAKKSLTKKQETKKPQVKSDWRRKHEDFINTIRSAKQLQAHMAAGGNLSDFPPPPPSDTSDYIQCPHCNRKFNQAAAERHIPKCETMLHNKPAHLRASKPRR